MEIIRKIPAAHFRPNIVHPVISGFRRHVDEISALLGCYAASCGNSFTDVWEQRIGPVFFDFLTLEDGTDTLSPNVGKELPFDAA